MKTRAAVLQAIGRPQPYAKSRPLVVEELELEPPGPGEVLVEIKAAGLCHSDLSVINGDRPRPTPMALGHEAAGIVRELGAGVSDLAPGDHVVMVFVPSCGRCVRLHGGPAGAVRAGRRGQHRRQRCSRAPGGCAAADGPVHHHWASRRSPSTPWSRATPA